MTGMNRQTGKIISGDSHLRQSLAELLTTPLNSRVMRPGYGSTLFNLVDAPLTTETTAQMTAAVIDAISQWEPRLELVSCKPRKIVDPAQGKVRFALVMKSKDTGETESIEINL